MRVTCTTILGLSAAGVPRCWTGDISPSLRVSDAGHARRADPTSALRSDNVIRTALSWQRNRCSMRAARKGPRGHGWLTSLQEAPQLALARPRTRGSRHSGQ